MHARLNRSIQTTFGLLQLSTFFHPTLETTDFFDFNLVIGIKSSEYWKIRSMECGAEFKVIWHCRQH